jgi:hypothetical protein
MSPETGVGGSFSTGFGESVWSGWWPDLPDDGDQRDVAPSLDAVDADRVRRLDAEQRGR